MIYATSTQLMAHQRLMRRLPVRAVVCADEPEAVPERPGKHLAPTRTRGWSGPSSREDCMLSLMCSGMYYTARHLASLANMNERAFYTHVKRMVQRGQLVRSGVRHNFLYRKA
jgi:hypothetical protein